MVVVGNPYGKSQFLQLGDSWMSVRHVVFALVVFSVATGSALAEGNPEKVKQVKAGTLKEARADWWGFDAEDSTKCLQAAIDSGVKTLTVPNMGKPWIVHPIKLASDQEIVFADGVVVEAIRGGFKGKNDCLLSARSQKNIVLRGTNATLRMHKKDYQDASRYIRAEWRHTVSFHSCENVKVIGLMLKSSGGDGVYIGDCRSPVNYCKDVVIKDCTIDDNHRQGISVISVVNLLIENCVITNTKGTAPQAGIDFEPNSKGERLFNITVRNCVFKDNAGAGVILCAHPNQDSAPISFVFENCKTINNRFTGGFGPNPPIGKIDFKMSDCVEIHDGKTKVYNSFWRDWQNMQILDKRKVEIIARAKRIAFGGLKLTPSDAVAYKTPKTIAQPVIRRKAGYVVYAHKGEKVSFAVTLMRDYGKGMTVDVAGPSGEEQFLGVVKGSGTKKELSFTAKGTGAYLIRIDPGPGWFALDARGRRIAAVALDGPLNLFGREALGDYYFHVPAGVSEFYVQAAGQGGERVKVSVYSALGILVEQKDQISVVHKFFGQRKDASKGELWRIRVDRPTGFTLEDFSLELFGVPSILARDKDSLLKP